MNVVQRYLLDLLVAYARLPARAQLLRVTQFYRERLWERARGVRLALKALWVAALVQARRARARFYFQLVVLLLKVEAGNLVQLCCAHTYYLEPPVPLVGPLYLDGCINLPLYLDPELRISLLDLPLQPRVLLLERPVLQAHFLDPIRPINIVHELLPEQICVLLSLQISARACLQADRGILFD